MKPSDLLLDPLGAEPEDRDPFAAQGAGRGQSQLRIAVMTSNPSLTLIEFTSLMTDHAGIAMVAGHHPATTVVGAGDVVGVAPAIEQQQHLSVFGQSVSDRTGQAWSDESHATDPISTGGPTLLGEINDFHLGQAQSRGAFGKAVHPGPTFLGVVPGFKGRGG